MKKILVLLMVLCLPLTGCSQKTNKNMIYQMKSTTDRQCMGYIIHDDEDHTIVIDGGTSDDREELVNKIKEIDDDDTVDAWFLTHYHDDHTGALVSYIRDDNSSIQIKKVYHQLPDNKTVESYEPTRLQNVVDIKNVLQHAGNQQTLKKGDQFQYGNITVDVLRNRNDHITTNYGNNSSIVYKVMLNKQSILFLGDVGQEASQELLDTVPNQIKNMDYLQLAHHGQAGGSEALYQWIQPKYCLWSCPQWLYDNKNGSYKTDETKKWLKPLHVKKNYYAFKGNNSIELK